MNTFLFLTSVAVLFFAGGVMVRTLTWMGRYFKLSEYTLSFILVAFATSLPELSVGINAAARNAPDLTLGNLVGANVLNVTLVIGISILLAGGLTVDRVVTKEDVQMTFGILVFPVFLLLDGTLGRSDGALLLFIFGGYVLYLINQEHAVVRVNEMLPDEFRFGIFLKKFGIFVLGAILLLISSWFVVSRGIALAHAYSLPLYFIGILVAIGTTLPETIFGIRSVFLRHGAMSLGNAFGSVIVNTSLVLGIVSLINPAITASNRALTGMLFAAGLVVVINFVAFSNGKLGRALGSFLLVIAALFIVISGS